MLEDCTSVVSVDSGLLELSVLTVILVIISGVPEDSVLIEVSVVSGD